MRFGRTYARVQIYRVVERMKLRGRGVRYLGRALTYTGQYLFRSRSRCGRRKVLIVLTTGESRDRVRRPARRLFASGVEIYAIGIGRVRRQSLLLIATGSRHVFNVAARRLVSITRIIKDRICSWPGKCISLIGHERVTENAVALLFLPFDFPHLKLGKKIHISCLEMLRNKQHPETFASSVKMKGRRGCWKDVAWSETNCCAIFILCECSLLICL